MFNLIKSFEEYFISNPIESFEESFVFNLINKELI
jgi:hypothetical protein